MATRRFCCLTDAGVIPMARSRNQVAWSKRETYICEFMWLVKSYSEASTAPLNVCTHSDIVALRLSLFAFHAGCRHQSSALRTRDLMRVIRVNPRWAFDSLQKFRHLL